MRKEAIPISGYANRIVTLKFPALAEAGENLFVALRNPRLVPPSELQPKEIALDADGRPVDLAAAQQANNEVIAKLIVGMRAYDATDFQVDAEGNPLPQRLLEGPVTPAVVAKLPMEIIKAISEELTAAVNPQ